MREVKLHWRQYFAKFRSMLMSAKDRPAKLHFQHNGFRVLSHGSFVPCAVTGEQIPLEELRYWSVDRQEAYSSPEVATRRLLGQG